MPSYSLGDMMSYATTNVGRRADLSASDVSRIVNEAYFEVVNMAPHREQEKTAVSSTTSGGYRLSLPEDFAEPISFSLQWSWSTASSAISSYQTLRETSESYLDANSPYPSGTPNKYAFFGTYIELHPSPNSSYSFLMRYRSNVTDLTALSDIPSLSTPWRKAVVLKAEEGLHRLVQEYDGEAAARNRFLQYVYSLKDERAIRQMAQTDPVVSMPALGNRGHRLRRR